MTYAECGDNFAHKYCSLSSDQTAEFITNRVGFWGELERLARGWIRIDLMDSCRVPIRNFPDPKVDTPLSSTPVEESGVLAGGCFWCVEAVFRELRGVISVRNGYAG